VVDHRHRTSTDDHIINGGQLYIDDVEVLEAGLHVSLVVVLDERLVFSLVGDVLGPAAAPHG